MSDGNVVKKDWMPQLMFYFSLAREKLQQTSELLSMFPRIESHNPHQLSQIKHCSYNPVTCIMNSCIPQTRLQGTFNFSMSNNATKILRVMEKTCPTEKSVMSTTFVKVQFSTLLWYPVSNVNLNAFQKH